MRALLPEKQEYCKKVLFPMLSDHFTGPWVGSKTLQTIKSLLACSLKDSLRIYSVSGGHHYLQITSDLSIAEFTDKLSKLQINSHDPDMVLPENQVPRVDK